MRLAALPNTKQHVLLDLHIAMNGSYCGIAQENRLMFKMFADINQITLSGLLLFAREKSILNKMMLVSFLLDKHKQYDCVKLTETLQDSLWDHVFMKTVERKENEALLHHHFSYADFSLDHLKWGGYFNKVLPLNTAGQDLAFFLEPNLVKVSPNTQKIVRFHDAIPLTHPHFVSKPFAKLRANALKHDAKEAFFVCNSDPTRQTLLSYMPQLENRSTVVPCAMPTHYRKVCDIVMLKKIMSRRLSSCLLNEKQIDRMRAMLQQESDPYYILHLATLDPKKNQTQLINAWKQLNDYHLREKPIKLVMVSHPGPFSEAIQDLMRQHVLSGNLIHLQAVSAEEMPYLYSHAQAFVFPSFIEGFGLPPMEAMQCECPAIVSDIATHRWVYGEAVLYCDPDEVNSLTERLLALLMGEQASETKHRLIKKGLIQIEQYTTNVLTGKWANVFDHLMELKYGHD